MAFLVFFENGGGSGSDSGDVVYWMVNGSKQAWRGGNEGGRKGSGKHIGIRFRTGTDGCHWPAMGGGWESKDGRKGSGE